MKDTKTRKLAVITGIKYHEVPADAYRPGDWIEYPIYTTVSECRVAGLVPDKPTRSTRQTAHAEVQVFRNDTEELQVALPRGTEKIMGEIFCTQLGDRAELLMLAKEAREELQEARRLHGNALYRLEGFKEMDFWSRLKFLFCPKKFK